MNDETEFKRLLTRACMITGEAKREGRDLSVEEASVLDKILSEAEVLKDKISTGSRDERLAALNEFAASRPIQRIPNPPPSPTGDITAGLPPRARPVTQVNNNLQAFDPRTGRPVTVLGKADSLVEIMGGNRTGLTFGGFLRAAVGIGNVGDYRAMLLEGTDSSGGYTVPEILVAEVVDLLRANSVLTQAGSVTMDLPAGGEVSMAKVTQDPGTHWHREKAAVPETTMNFGRITFRPKTLISYVKVSRELMEDSLNADAALTNAFAQALALEVDRTGLLGTGASGEPLGVLHTPGIGSVDMGTDGAALADYKPFVDAGLQLAQANSPGPTAYIMAPRTYAQAANLVDSTGQPMMKPDAVADIPFLQTTSIPIDDTQGTSNDASRIYAGYWPNLVWGVRRDLMIEILREKHADEFAYAFQAHLRGDWALLHPESFATVNGVTE